MKDSVKNTGRRYVTETVTSITLFLPREGIGFMNFDYWHCGPQTEDLCLFMRKILEKHNWDPEIGRRMAEQYNRKAIAVCGRVETSETVPFLSVEVLETGKLLCIQSEGMDIRKNIEKIEQATALWRPWQRFLQSFC